MKELLELIVTKLRDLDTEINKLHAKEVKDEFKIGSSNIFIPGISDNQAVYAVSVLNSRLTASKLLKGRTEAMEECRTELEEFLESVEHHDKLKVLKTSKSEYIRLREEVESLLSDDERREIFKEKYNKIVKGKELN